MASHGPKKKTARSLYDLAIDKLVDILESTHPEWPDYLSNVMSLHVFSRMMERDYLETLHLYIRDPEVFVPLLNVTSERPLVHRLYHRLIEEGLPIHDDHANDPYAWSNLGWSENVNDWRRLADMAVKLADFLMEAGWAYQAAVILEHVASSASAELVENQMFLLEVRILMFQAYVWNRDFEQAELLGQQLLNRFSSADPTQRVIGYLRPLLFSNLSQHYYAMGRYGEAHQWCVESLRELRSDCHPKILVDILAQASKVFVIKRDFAKAKVLAQQAVRYAKDIFGESHIKYSDCLQAMGNYLQNGDDIPTSCIIYQRALAIREEQFGKMNLKSAFAMEDLAYVTYVKEYTSGDFLVAKKMAEESLHRLNFILPKEHFHKASAKRVLALIMEEVAIDNDDESSYSILEKAETFHFSALSLTEAALGEVNVVTAKHYGNLGRLYQSMKKFPLAEQKLLQAIRIKEQLLGPDDFDVGLTVGHLASLYTYDMGEYAKAKDLYLRSLAISTNLFGPTYSELHYDYRGLVRAYQALGDQENFQKYLEKFEEWKNLIHTNHQCIMEDHGEQMVKSIQRVPIAEIVAETTKGAQKWTQTSVAV